MFHSLQVKSRIDGFSREPSPGSRRSQPSSPLAELRMKASPVLSPISGGPQVSPRSRGRSPRSSPKNALKRSGTVDPLEESVESVGSVGSLGELVLPARVRKLQEARRREEADAVRLQQTAKSAESMDKEKGNCRDMKKVDEGDEECVEGAEKKTKEKRHHVHAPSVEPPAAMVAAEMSVYDIQHHSEASPKRGENAKGSNDEGQMAEIETQEVEIEDEKGIAEEDGTPSVESEQIKIRTNSRERLMESQEELEEIEEELYEPEDDGSESNPEHHETTTMSCVPSDDSSDTRMKQDATERLNVYTESSPVSERRPSNQEPSPTLDTDGPPVSKQESATTDMAVVMDKDGFSDDDLSSRGNADDSLAQFDTDSSMDEDEYYEIDTRDDTSQHPRNNSNIDPLQGMSEHLRRGANGSNDQVYPEEHIKNADDSDGVLEDFDESNSSTLSTPSMRSHQSFPGDSPDSSGDKQSSPRAHEEKVVEHNGDALRGLIGVHEARARSIRQISPRMATPGANRHRFI